MPNNIDTSTTQTPPVSTEVVLHELGEALAVSLASVQNELARYPNELGAYLLDEVEVTIPVHIRVDELGQLRARTVEDTTDKSDCGQVRIRIRPVVGASQSVPKCADQPLSTLGDALTPEAIKRLEDKRVFSIEDFLRIARDTAGQRAIEKLIPEVKLNSVIERTMLFTIPDISPSIAATLVQAGVTSLGDLVKRDTQSLVETLNKKLEGRLEKEIQPEDVGNLQSSIRKATLLHIPNIRPGQ